MASGQLPDVTIRPNGTLAPIQETTCHVGRHLACHADAGHLSYAGQEAEQPKYFNITSGATTTHLGVGNPAVVTTGCATEDGACSVNLQAENQINGRLLVEGLPGQVRQLPFRDAVFLYQAQVLCRRRPASHAPTDDSMVFTSIRYYPF